MTVGIGTPSRLHVSDSALDAGNRDQETPATASDPVESLVDVVADQPIPKYRRYQRPIVRLRRFCCDDARRRRFKAKSLSRGIGEGA
jgi:hypothetical protein